MVELEPEPFHETEIIHERKAFNEDYLTPAADDEEAQAAALLKEVKGIREELKKLNEIIGIIARKQG